MASGDGVGGVGDDGMCVTGAKGSSGPSGHRISHEGGFTAIMAGGHGANFRQTFAQRFIPSNGENPCCCQARCSVNVPGRNREDSFASSPAPWGLGINRNLNGDCGQTSQVCVTNPV